MKQKLYRSDSMFRNRKQHPFLKTAGSILLCLAVTAAGFFTAKWVTERQQDAPIADTVISDTAPSNTPSDSTSNQPGNDEQPGGSNKVDPSLPVDAVLETVRGFYLPHAALRSDDLIDTLTAARNAGYNAVLFDLKDAEGNLYYRFADAQANKVNSFAANAFTAEELSSLFDLMRKNGLHPIPRLYAFRDNAACAVLTDARISYAENHSWAWYDGDKTKGAKKWLNPYSDAAQSYIQSLATELKAQGASAVMLDGVQFPEKLSSSAYLGEKAATITKADVLSAFVAATRSALGADCPLLLGCTSAGALATDTKEYGGNPLTFGATMASPLLTSDVQEAVEKMVLRSQVLEQKPTLAPLLQTTGLSQTQAAQTITACLSGGTDSFILYHPDGQYDFSTALP